jgi:hypothetical protein
MKKEKKDKCEICGTQLEYASIQADYRELECYFCKNQFHTNTFCPNGHYICDQCHSKTPIKIIKDFCERTDIKDPFIIAEKIMSHPKFKMYGPEHHALTPAVILTALKNNDILKPNEEKITLLDINEGINRGAKIPGGYCGFYGACGAGIGSGIAISVYTGSNPSKDIPRSLANEMTSRSLNKISDDLEHCCKRSVRISICEVLNFLKEKFDINLDYEPKGCTFSSLNKKCEHIKCPIN